MAHGSSSDDSVDPFTRTQRIFTEEDHRLVKECSQEALVYRCLPLALGSGFLVRWGVAAQKIKGHPTWGPIPKIVGTTIMSWFVGQVMYRKECQKKLMANPNSVIGWRMRLARGMLSEEEMNNPPGNYNPSMIERKRPISGFPSRAGPPYSEAPVEQPNQDDRTRETGANGRYKSFDEIRHEHRKEYTRRWEPRPSQPAPLEAPTATLTNSPEAFGSPFHQDSNVAAPKDPDDYSPAKRYQKKNKYGDPIET